MVALVLLAGGATALVAFMARDGGVLASTDDRVLLMERRLSGSGSLLVAQPGAELREAVEVATDVSRSLSIRIRGLDAGRQAINASLVQTGGGLALAYVDNDERTHLVSVSGEEVTELFDTPHDTDFSYLPDVEGLLVVESTSSAQRCHLVAPGGESQRIASADFCGSASDGSSVVIASSSDGDTNVELYSTDDGTVTQYGTVSGVIDQQLGSHLKVDTTGRVLAVTQSSTNGHSYLSILDETGRIREEQRCEAGSNGWLPEAGLGALLWCLEEDELMITLVDAEGSQEVYRASPRPTFVQPARTGNARWLVLKGEEETLLRLAPGDGAIEEVAQGVHVGTTYTWGLEHMFARILEDIEGDSSVIFMSDQETGELLALGEFYTPVTGAGTSPPFLLARDEVEGDYHLGRVDVDALRVEPILEDWRELSLLDPDGDEVVVTGVELEGDDARLIVVAPDATVRTVDREPFFSLGSTAGDSVYYTAYTDPDAEAPEVRRIDYTADRIDPEVMWDGVVFLGTTWSG